MDLAKMDKEVLEKCVEARREVTQRVDRVVALAHLLSLLRGCDGMIRVDAGALGRIGDMISDEVCGIQEVLDGFICVTEAEGVLGE